MSRGELDRLLLRLIFRNRNRSRLLIRILIEVGLTESGTLGKKLLEGTLAKMSDSGIGVLKAANVDINAIVTGAGEALIARIKNGDV